MSAISERLATTRDGLHRVAEHILAAAQFRDGNGIELRYSPGGFETLRGLRDGHRIAVANGNLVVVDRDSRRESPLSTLAAAARFAGITAGLPGGTYPPATPLDLDAPLEIDAASADVLAEWYRIGDEALRAFATELGDTAQQPILWPEHFDIGITIDAVNYGASPGDDTVDEPYVYVGPHAGPPRRDEFWNAPFGAFLPSSQVHSAGDAVAFFRRGRSLL
jgi:hypothetical protein